MKYAKIKKLDVANGTGLRVSLFVSGCPHHCIGCFNPETWSYDYGKDFTRETIDCILNLLSYGYINGLSVLGGEPLAQDRTLYQFLAEVKATYPKKDIWLYTGYTYEKIKYNKPLNYVDVLVDGEFMIDKKDVRLKFRGSSNQRIIDVKKSRLENKVVLYNLED